MNGVQCKSIGIGALAHSKLLHKSLCGWQHRL